MIALLILIALWWLCVSLFGGSSWYRNNTRDLIDHMDYLHNEDMDEDF